VQKRNKPDIKEASRKPPWLKVTGFSGHEFERVQGLLKQLDLNTVCQAANCPNRGECFSRGTATFLILGPLCTRNCAFCNIDTGQPSVPDPDEPERVSRAAATLNLRHVVVTSVTRDDLPDGGARQFAETVAAIRRRLPETTVEILTPDFKAVTERAIEILMAAPPDIFNHNVETVPALYPTVRPGADYRRSLDLLRRMKESGGLTTKSGLMVGLGENRPQLQQVFTDLASVGVSILTIGQYLAPSRNHHPVVRYLSPDEMETLGADAQNRGIPHVISSPLVRSSYRAEQFADRS
jgi:lipoic acid synthetase